MTTLALRWATTFFTNWTPTTTTTMLQTGYSQWGGSIWRFVFNMPLQYNWGESGGQWGVGVGG